MQTFIVILTAFFAFGLPILVFEAANGKGYPKIQPSYPDQ